MKGAKFFTFLNFSLFFIAVAFTSGCSSPIGGLMDSADYIKAMPSRFLYGKTDWFKPAEHVKVIGVYGGVEGPIDIDKVQIKIINDEGFAANAGDEDTPPIPREQPVKDNQEGIMLEYEGVKTVVITYDKLEASYKIAVGEPGTNENGGWGDGGTGVVIIWPDP